MKRQRMVWVVAVATMVLAGGCSRQSRPGEYRTREHGFGIIPPAGWETQEGTGMPGVAFLSPPQGPGDMFRENVNVVVEKLPSAMTTEEYAKACSDMMAIGMTDFRSVSETAVEVNGRTAMRYVSTYRVGSNDIKAISYLTAKGKKGYVITCTALPNSFDEFEKTFEECCRTFMVD